MPSSTQQTAETVPALRSYEDAVNFWRNSKPWRKNATLTYDTWDRGSYKMTHSLVDFFEEHGGVENVRPLGHRARKYRNILRDGDDIVIRLYDTDIVTYHPNGDITLVPWCSKLTETIVAKLLPAGLLINYTLGLPRRASDRDKFGPVVFVQQDHRYYLLTENEPYRFVRYDTGETQTRYPSFQSEPCVEPVYGWHPPTTMPFERRVMDRAKARAALAETNYAEFRDVLKATRALRGHTPQYTKWWVPETQLLNILEDKSTWDRLIAWRAPTDTLLRRMRNAIYDREDVVVTISKPYLTSSAELRAFVNNRE